MTGPLHGLRIIEIAGIGPGPFCGMMLADHGAEVIRVERPGGVRAGSGSAPARDPLQRSRRSITVDLKHADGIAIVRALARASDGLIEGFRPGVMERLGLGPKVLLADNPKLVFGRITGWGQDGPWSGKAGHDIDYIALSGSLNAFGEAGRKPVAPINMVADFGGGGMLLAFGMLAALLNVQRGGQGQVVDASMLEGSALLMSMIWGFRAQGSWNDARGTNRLDGGAHFYDTYETADGKYVAIGAVEPQFYAALCRGLELDPDLADPRLQSDPAQWLRLKHAIAERFRTKSRAQWDSIFADLDACYAPILSFDEALTHPHNSARATFGAFGGVTQPMPAPRYSSSATTTPRMSGTMPDEGDAILAEIGTESAQIAKWRAGGALAARQD
ncbi:MAG: CaiB/BaiF CoA-transferase family protein [Pseudomonadota bacterium]